MTTDPPTTYLLVDDDRGFCAALGSALRRRGARVVVAHNDEEALSEARAWTPDRAIVDLRMPGRGGLEIVSALLAEHPSLAVVVLTGYGSIATAVEAIKRGALHYLTKPTELDEILAAFEPHVPELPPSLPTATPQSLEEVEWEHLQRVLADCGGNVSEAARQLGMHRRSLQRKLARGRPTTPDRT